MKTIDLEEILEGCSTYETEDKEIYLLKQDIKEAMKEACKQTLELASENAEYYYGEGLDVHINKQSILDTIKQVK